MGKNRKNESILKKKDLRKTPTPAVTCAKLMKKKRQKNATHPTP